ncbi:MAG: glycosyltransferase, partial [Muribaculaceae bacterium]|nr:glycosyltransferase [Muribaculaceae bacterium]
ATGLKQKILVFTDRLTCACATHIVPEGEGVKNDLMRFGITRKPLRVLGHGNVRGIDLDHYRRDAPGVDQAAAAIRRKGVFTFVFIGRMVADKGVNELVEAFAALNRECPATRLILVGPDKQTDDPLRPETEADIDRNQAIEPVGRQTDVRPWLAAADALILPSYREGFPNVVIEAGAMGLPSIVTDINGSREIITEGENGLIVTPRNSGALLEAMRRLATDSALAATLAANARSMVASRFEQSYVRRCLKEFYNEILSQR